MSLVIFTAFVGLIAAPGTIHPWLAFVALLAIAVGAGAAGALNMWYDADIDAKMKRTAQPPVPKGAITPEEALGFGMTLAVGSVLVLGLLVNVLAGALLAFTIFFYIAIYTMWLKRLTPQNIVIGGAAGAFPPMVGWVSVTGSIDLGSIALFLIIFVWTPPHFWALALWKKINADYANAGVPMLPVVAGADETRRQILLYTLLLVPVTLLPALTGTVGCSTRWPISGSASCSSGTHGRSTACATRRLSRPPARSCSAFPPCGCSSSSPSSWWSARWGCRCSPRFSDE